MNAPCQWPASMPDYDYLCARWHEAVVANHLTKWHALSSLLESIAHMCEYDDLDEAADSMRTLSAVARRRAIDLQPVRDEAPMQVYQFGATA